MIDESDFDLIAQYNWFINNKGYATHQPKNGKVVFMHRLILGLTERDHLCDHKNHKRLDNRRSNLRKATYKENARNSSSHGETKYLGVTYQNCSYKSVRTGEILTYRYLKAKIRVDNKLIHLGTFKKEEDAALAYNLAATKYFGEFANLNDV